MNLCSICGEETKNPDLCDDCLDNLAEQRGVGITDTGAFVEPHRWWEYEGGVNEPRIP